MCLPFGFCHFLKFSRSIFGVHSALNYLKDLKFSKFDLNDVRLNGFKLAASKNFYFLLYTQESRSNFFGQFLIR